MREPLPSVSEEIERYNIVCGSALDEEGQARQVTRLEGETDDSYRVRINEVERVRRKANRVERGESLLPLAMANLSPADSVPPTEQDLANYFEESHQAISFQRQALEFRATCKDLLEALNWVQSLPEFGPNGAYELHSRAKLIPLIQRATNKVYGHE